MTRDRAGGGGSSRASGFVLQSIASLGSRLVVTLINIPISILVVRSLGAAGQGAYSAAQATAACTSSTVCGMSTPCGITW